MSEQLRACPFCGGEAMENLHAPSIEKVICCDDCGSGAFITNWNTRPIEDKQATTIRLLREDGKKLSRLLGELKIAYGYLKHLDGYVAIEKAIDQHNALLKQLDEQEKK